MLGCRLLERREKKEKLELIPPWSADTLHFMASSPLNSGMEH